MLYLQLYLFANTGKFAKSRWFKNLYSSSLVELSPQTETALVVNELNQEPQSKIGKCHNTQVASAPLSHWRLCWEHPWAAKEQN